MFDGWDICSRRLAVAKDFSMYGFSFTYRCHSIRTWRSKIQAVNPRAPLHCCQPARYVASVLWSLAPPIVHPTYKFDIICALNAMSEVCRGMPCATQLNSETLESFHLQPRIRRGGPATLIVALVRRRV